jgi:hypothetical protein
VDATAIDTNPKVYCDYCWIMYNGNH